MIYNSVIDTIGRTPVIRLNHIAPAHVEMFVKVEAFNPLASVKDRLAWAIVNDAERKGKLTPGMTVVEATSGMKSGVQPWILCGCHSFPPSSDAPDGSVATMFTSGRASLMTSPAPVSVPPVPYPDTQ